MNFKTFNNKIGRNKNKYVNHEEDTYHEFLDTDN